MAGDGNDAAFAALHRRYDAILHGYTRSIARDADDSADALQNTWIAALIALRADRRSAPVRPWLFRIAHNSAVDVLRRRSAAVRPIDRGFLAVAPSADEQYAHSETVAEVVGDLRELPTNQRAALVMRELADLDYGEIAIALSTSEGNARQLVFAAREGLRESRAGRALPCEAVRGVLARADGRELRRRRLRAHLDSCRGCRAYAATVERPARKVAGWTPVPAVLQTIFAAAGGSGAAATQGGGFAGLAKGAVAAALVVTGVGTGEVFMRHDGGRGLRDAAAELAAPSGALSDRAAGELAHALSPRKASVSPSRRTRSAAARTHTARPAIARGAAGRRSAAPATTPVRAERRALRTSQGSRGAPGGSAPSDRDPRPHTGDRYAGAEPAGPRGHTTRRPRPPTAAPARPVMPAARVKALAPRATARRTA